MKALRKIQKIFTLIMFTALITMIASEVYYYQTWSQIQMSDEYYKEVSIYR